jgi:hypothetical protein
VGQGWDLFNQFASYQAANSNMPVEHPPVSNADVWLLPNDVHDICEWLDAQQAGIFGADRTS